MRILCLDDEPLALKMLQLAVEKAKPEAEILTFSKQRELIAEAESGGCDVAFLDRCAAYLRSIIYLRIIIQKYLTFCSNTFCSNIDKI